jgi:hypothetical protein
VANRSLPYVLEYHNSIQDAVADLGKPEEIGKVFASFQRFFMSSKRLDVKSASSVSRKSQPHGIALLAIVLNRALEVGIVAASSRGHAARCLFQSGCFVFARTHGV